MRREEFLLKLLIEVKEVELYLGNVDEDGRTVRSGLLEVLSVAVDGISEGLDLKKLANEAARKIEDRGDPFTALQLFTRAGNSLAIVDLLLPRLSAELFNRSSFERNSTLKTSRQFLMDRRDRRENEERMAKMIRSLGALVKIADFLDLYWSNKLDRVRQNMHQKSYLKHQKPSGEMYISSRFVVFCAWQ